MRTTTSRQRGTAPLWRAAAFGSDSVYPTDCQSQDPRTDSAGSRRLEPTRCKKRRCTFVSDDSLAIFNVTACMSARSENIKESDSSREKVSESTKSHRSVGKMWKKCSRKNWLITASDVVAERVRGITALLNLNPLGSFLSEQFPG